MLPAVRCAAPNAPAHEAATPPRTARRVTVPASTHASTRASIYMTPNSVDQCAGILLAPEHRSAGQRHLERGTTLIDQSPPTLVTRMQQRAVRAPRRDHEAQSPASVVLKRTQQPGCRMSSPQTARVLVADLPPSSGITQLGDTAPVRIVGIGSRSVGYR